MVTVLLREYGVNFWSLGALPLGIVLDLALGGFPRKPKPGRRRSAVWSRWPSEACGRRREAGR